MSLPHRVSDDSHVILRVRMDALSNALLADVRYWRVPDDGQMRDLAVRLRTVLAGPLTACSPAATAAAFGWRYRVRPVGRPDSPVQSVLAPLRVGGFSVVVNAHHSRSDAEALWLVVHEIGHSFFFAPGQPPRRIVPVTPEEERFCDLLADETVRDPVASQRVRVA